MRFANRVAAGRELAAALETWRGDARVLVLGIPRGGVVVAAEVARELGAPLDVCVAHKIGAPGNPEFAIGAIAVGGEALLNEESVRSLRIPPAYVAREVETQRKEVERKVRAYRADAPAFSIANRVVILIDDGLATGSTALAACRALRGMRPARLVLALPVAPEDLRTKLQSFADEVVVLHAVKEFRAVGEFYAEFEQVRDVEVVALLREKSSS